jgi:hypothetical protein
MSIPREPEMKESIFEGKDREWIRTPRTMLAPRSNGWFNSVALASHVRWDSKNESQERLDEEIDDLIKHKAWEVFPREKPAGSLSKLLALILNIGEQELRQQYRGRHILTGARK